MASTYTPIATQTLGSAATSVTFSSIPSTYTDIIIISSILAANNGDQSLQFNLDGANNYSQTRLTGNGTTAASQRDTNSSYIVFPLSSLWGASATSPTVTICHIQNYSNTSTYKTVLIRDNNASTGYGGTALGTAAAVGLWRSTSAISTIKISASGLNAGSTFTLYGIKAA